MRWLLLIELCSPLTARCEWRVADSFRTEEACVIGALMIPSINFRCRERRIESVPLPRPRPKNDER
jgi:hypothetical protein